MIAAVARVVLVCLLWALGLGPAACRCADRPDPVGPAPIACEQKGTVYLADKVRVGSHEVSVRAVHGGCAPCPASLAKGAGAGNKCSLHRVCAERCCACPGRHRSFTATACNGGACASEAVACETALARFGTELCGLSPGPGSR